MSSLKPQPHRAENSLSLPFQRWAASAVCGLTFLAYASTLRFQFVHDDRGQIVGNPAIRSWHFVPGYFTSHVWAAVAPSFLGNDYRPIFLLWLRFNAAIFGLHAVGWHLTTVLAHVAATYCVYRLAMRIFGEMTTALCSGLIFGLHPVHIEAVAWISGVPEPLLADLLIPAYLCWLRSRDATVHARRWLIASLGLYALAMLTKETAVVLVMIILVTCGLSFSTTEVKSTPAKPGKFMRLFQPIVPYLLLTVAYVVVRTVALKGFSHPAAQISWWTVLRTWPSLLWFYLRLLVWPVGLSPFYGLQYVAHSTLLNTILPLVALIALAAGLWRWAIRSRTVALALSWLIFPVLPVLNIQIFGDGNFAHNRYLYLPSVGFALLVAEGLGNIKLARRLSGRGWSWQAVVCGFLALLFGLAIQFEDRYYASDVTFYSYAYSHAGPSYPVLGMDCANALAEQGEYAHAALIYRELIQAHPDMWNAYFNLGYAYSQQGDLASAAESLSQAATGDPSNAGARFYLGLVDLKLHRLDEAELNLRRALALSPAAPNYHFALGVILKVKGDTAGALAEFDKELELNPAHRAAAQQAAELRHARAAN